MKVKLLLIKDAMDAIKRISNAEVSVGLAFNLLDTYKKLEYQYNNMENVREQLIKSLGEEIKDQPGVMSVKEENREEFFKKMQELHETECDLDITPLDRKEFLAEPNLKVSANDMRCIEWIQA